MGQRLAAHMRQEPQIPGEKAPPNGWREFAKAEVDGAALVGTGTL